MTKNLDTADTIVKLTLAVAVVVFYFGRVISGPVARGLVILAIALIVRFVAKALLLFITRD
ncbi:hypothetical protein [Dawidia soli]|uniref:Uncharacterized protein n=1 Tax=Dawidia soli TaxID=2782352 RepID=A0AAP2D6V0_9BACT|nr:hypothetical protein [Dawidia soli]MBT1686461.1 hypothetical protein [Dawidia soli]